MNPRKAGCFFLLLLLACAPLTLAQGTYTQIDVPGSITTEAVGINTQGDIVGFYADSNNIFHAFLLSGGVYTTFDYPGAAGTDATAINDLGQIVGPYFPTIDSLSGYLYDVQTQTFTTVSFPNKNYSTTPEGINNAGTIVGFIGRPNGPVGFELVGGTYREVLPQGYSYSVVYAVNNSGQELGSAFTATSINFLFNQGHFHRSGVPPIDTPHGINDVNAIVGEYISTNNPGLDFYIKTGRSRGSGFRHARRARPMLTALMPPEWSLAILRIQATRPTASRGRLQVIRQRNRFKPKRPTTGANVVVIGFDLR